MWMMMGWNVPPRQVYDRQTAIVIHDWRSTSENVLQLVDIIGDILTYISYLYALAVKRKNQLYFNLVLIYTVNKVKSKEGKRRNGLCHEIFLFTSKIKTHFITFSLFEERIYYLIAFSWQQLAIIRNKNCTFAYRKSGELLDWKLSFSMTLEN